LTIRANNQTLHQTYELAVSTASQLSNENAYPSINLLVNNKRYILDYLLDLDPALSPQSPPREEQVVHLPSPLAFNRDAHFGYSPTPDPLPEAATQLTQEQIDTGMFKAQVASTVDMMGPLKSIQREEDGNDAFTGRSTAGSAAAGSSMGRSGHAGSRTMVSTVPSAARRKRKDRDNEADENVQVVSRKKKG
jgi:hypothetical protein